MTGLLVLVAAAFATIFHADRARREFLPAALAETALARTLSGEDPTAAIAALRTMRDRLRVVPLDSATRTIAASLLVESATTAPERTAAYKQAAAALRLVPADEWVARASALVAARCGETDAALRTIRSIFDYAPAAAADALSAIEPFVPADRVELGIPAIPEAWLAWSLRLEALSRHPEADARLAALLDRWPDDLDALQHAATIAAGRERPDELVRLVPPSLVIPKQARLATLFALRAKSRALQGDTGGARSDARQATALRPDDPWVTVAAGDALVIFDSDAARDAWTRALFATEAQPSLRETAVWIRLRLARLDDREGRGADALRTWRSILAVRPDSEEARRRVEELTGGSLR